MKYQKVEVIGIVGRDPSSREVNVGGEMVPVVNISLATLEKPYKGNVDGNTLWIDVALWRGLVKIVERYVKKGAQIHVSGHLNQPGYFYDARGEVVPTLKMTANFLTLCGGGNGDRHVEEEYHDGGQVEEYEEDTVEEIFPDTEDSDLLPDDIYDGDDAAADELVF